MISKSAESMCLYNYFN